MNGLKHAATSSTLSSDPLPTTAQDNNCGIPFSLDEWIRRLIKWIVVHDQVRFML